MNPLSRLGLTAEQVARMTGAKLPVEKPAPVIRTDKRPQQWLINWLQGWGREEFTTAQVAKLNSRTRATTAVAVSVAKSCGMVEMVQRATGCKRSIWTRTTKPAAKHEHQGFVLNYIMDLRPGETIDWCYPKSVSKQATLAVISRAVLSGHLILSGKQERSDTTYRKIIK